MSVDLNDDGTFTINEGSTYPTTEADDCSTYSVVPAVSENGTWTSTPGLAHPDDPYSYSMGWGISLSEVFAQFGAADLVNGQYGVDYGPGTAMENWGMVEELADVLGAAIACSKPVSDLGWRPHSEHVGQTGKLGDG
jgi:hypothetical protein